MVRSINDWLKEETHVRCRIWTNTFMLHMPRLDLFCKGAEATLKGPIPVVHIGFEVKGSVKVTLDMNSPTRPISGYQIVVSTSRLMHDMPLTTEVRSSTIRSIMEAREQHFWKLPIQNFMDSINQKCCKFMQRPNLHILASRRTQKNQRVRLKADGKRFNERESEAINAATEFLLSSGLEMEPEFARRLMDINPVDLEKYAKLFSRFRPVLRYLDKDRFEEAVRRAHVRRVMDS